MRPVMVVDRVGPDDSGAGDSPTAPETALWAAAAPYVPSVLLDAFRQDPDRPAISIDAVEGTLVFADISGFTALSERLAGLGREGPERLTEIINGNFQLLLDIARQRGGGNLKFGGDALALLFEGPGQPTAP
jgi:class 3 adenylate cyclase